MGGDPLEEVMDYLASHFFVKYRGTVVDNGNGSYTYTPDADFNGTDTFITELLTGKRSSYQMEKRYFRADGHTIWELALHIAVWNRVVARRLAAAR